MSAKQTAAKEMFTLLAATENKEGGYLYSIIIITFNTVTRTE